MIPVAPPAAKHGADVPVERLDHPEGDLLMALTANGHLPAYPPGTYNPYGYNGTPQLWMQQNDARWQSDPYAEDALRLFNFPLYPGMLRDPSVHAARSRRLSTVTRWTLRSKYA